MSWDSSILVRVAVICIRRAQVGDRDSIRNEMQCQDFSALKLLSESGRREKDVCLERPIRTAPVVQSEEQKNTLDNTSGGETNESLADPTDHSPGVFWLKQ